MGQKLLSVLRLNVFEHPYTCITGGLKQDPCDCVGGAKENVATDFLLKHGAVKVQKATAGLSVADALATMYKNMEH